MVWQSVREKGPAFWTPKFTLLQQKGYGQAFGGGLHSFATLADQTLNWWLTVSLWVRMYVECPEWVTLEGIEDQLSCGPLLHGCAVIPIWPGLIGMGSRVLVSKHNLLSQLHWGRIKKYGSGKDNPGAKFTKRIRQRWPKNQLNLTQKLDQVNCTEEVVRVTFGSKVSGAYFLKLMKINSTI